MNAKTVKTLLWAAIACLLLGMLVMSPAAGFMLYLLASILAAFPAFAARKITRLAAIMLLGVSLLLVFDSYPKFRADMKAYRTKAIEKQSR